MAIRTPDAIQKLCSLIVQHGLVSATDISMAYQRYLLEKIQSGHCQYVLETDLGRLVLQERGAAAGEMEWSNLDMPAPAFHGKWVPYTSEKLALFDYQGRFRQVEQRSQPEIIPAGQGGYVFAVDKTFLLSALLNRLLPLENADRGPYDFYFPPHQSDGVFLSDRAMGTLMMTDMTLNMTRARLKLREPGSKKALCLAYSGETQRCYVSDHETSDLIVIEPRNQNMERHSLPHGTLGNLVLDAQRQQLLILLAGADQEPAVVVYALSDLSHQGTILLPGKRFSSLDDPCDLMGISPDGESLLVMTYSDDPALGTPMISQIRLADHQLLNTHTLKEEEKPIGFAFYSEAPQSKDIADFDDFLEAEGVVEKPLIIGLIRQIEAIEADKNKPLFDQDVESAMSHIADNFSQAEIHEVAELSQQAVASLQEESFFEWQGRDDMDAEEKQVFVERMSQIQADEKVAQTNGVFVLNWLKGIDH